MPWAVKGTALVLVLLAGAAAAQREETLQRVGKTVVRYNGPEVEAVLSYRFAAANPGEPWMLLMLAVTGKTAKAVEIKRDKIYLLAPDGARVPLASQAEFAKASRGLRAMLARASINQEPLDYWGGRATEGLQLFALPGEGLAFDAVMVNHRIVAMGPIFFHFPAGVPTGTFRLAFEVGESQVRIPFELARR